MSESSIEFTVIGRPQPAGSKRAFLNRKTGRPIITDDAKLSRPWKQEVAGAAIAAFDGTDPIDGPVTLEITFYLARPKGHFGSGRNAGRLRAAAPSYPTTRPDATKLLRAVEDALLGIAFRDDGQVVDQFVFKRYGTPERAVVRVHPMLASAGAIGEAA